MAVEAAIPGRQAVSGRIDPATGEPLPKGVSYRGPKQYMARKKVSITVRILILRPVASWS
ncbi:hypothetical protein AA0522_2379 [Gluconacetobacter liquefaciens NRIC 0522]|nr:hypothetical protein AA0522_2379 [Gluconacetobacter liquefaciens NRIC 0522]